MKIKAKLIIVFIAVKILPILILVYISFIGIKKSQDFLHEKIKSLLSFNDNIINDISSLVVSDSVKFLNHRSQFYLEKMTQNLGNEIADFLYDRDKDLLFLANIPILSKSIFKSFYDNKTREVIIPMEFKYDDNASKWIPKHNIKYKNNDIVAGLEANKKYFHHSYNKRFKTKPLRIYKEISFINLQGQEKTKISSISRNKRNIKNRKNTYINSERYFNEIQKLKKGEIFVSSIIGEYVGSKIIGSFTKEKAKKLGIKFRPQDHGYAGIENPKGKKFEGIIRIITPRYENNKKIGYMSLAIDYAHIAEFTDYLFLNSNPPINYSDASLGSNAFMYDNENRAISHHRDYYINGFNKKTGKRVRPWLSKDIGDEFRKSNQSWEEFSETYPIYNNQSYEKKADLSQLEEGLIPLDCKYLNFAPACFSFNQILTTGGYGSFAYTWSGVDKFTSISNIPYYSGKYGDKNVGFGLIVFGSNLKDFHLVADETTKSIIDIANKKHNAMSDFVKNIDKDISSLIDNSIDTLYIITLIIIILIIIIAILVSNHITKSINQLTHGAKKFSNHELDHRIIVHSKDEIGDLANVFNNMATNIEKLFNNQTDINNTLEKQVADKTKHIRDSINYASLIQEAIILHEDKLHLFFNDLFVYWEPKDIVGGDIYLHKVFDNGDCLLMCMDCTGHGVSGAFVTMLVKAIEQQISTNIANNLDNPMSPSEILSYFNKGIKELLNQKDKTSISNVGFDGGVMYFSKENHSLKYASANTPLFYIDENQKLKTIKSHRYSVGYKNCDLNHQYEEYNINLHKGMKFYISSDGYFDQQGGKQGFGFSKKRFKDLIQKNHHEPFQEQREIFRRQLLDYQDDAIRLDDVMIIAFEI